jgi:transposase-like protein
MTKRKRKNYTKEFKDEAVKLITVQGYSVAEASRKLGVPPVPFFMTQGTPQIRCGIASVLA